jgi:hypothetical protein
MCNNCDCENYEKCSIVGHLPYGTCCPECRYYDEKHSCGTYAFKYVAPLVSESLEPPVGEKSKIIALSQKQFP